MRLHPRRVPYAFALSLAAVLSACSLLIDTRGLGDGASSPEEGAPIDGAAPTEGSVVEAGADAPDADASISNGCPTGRGPKMINVGTHCIDSTEVTQAQYAEFLSAKGGDTSGQIPQCAWNSTFAPNPGCMHPYDPVAFPNRPIGGEDWCDARAYCEWAGKHLCGRIGGGGWVPGYGQNEPTVSEWFAACSHAGDGAHAYPYGSTYQATACNGGDRPGGRSADVGSFTACEGGFPGLFDMSGNLLEWENSCSPEDGGANAICSLRGGAFWGGVQELRCDFLGPTIPRNYTDGDCDLTIRCCADLQ